MSTVLIAVIAFILGGNMGILLMCLAQTSAEAERRSLEYYAGRSGKPGGEPGDQYDEAEPADGGIGRLEVPGPQAEREAAEADAERPEAGGTAADQKAEGSQGPGRETDSKAAGRPEPGRNEH